MAGDERLTLRLGPLGGALLGLLLAAPGAQAATPWGLVLSEEVTHDSNVFRASDANAAADTLSNTGLRLTLNQPLGRQQWNNYAAVNLERYLDHSAWNHVAYDVGSELDWSAPELWQGELGASASQQLYRADQDVAEPLRNLDRARRAWLRARKGVVTDWTFELAVNGFQRDLSLASSDSLDQRQGALEAGVGFQPNPDLRTRLLGRRTVGEYPHLADGTRDHYTRNDLELGLDWQPSGASTLAGRVAWGREDHSVSSQRSANVWAGSLAWRWQPTGKLNFETRLQRDNDTGSSRFQQAGSGSSGSGSSGGSASDTQQNTDAKLSTSAGLTAQWTLSALWRLNAAVALTHRALDRAASSGTDTQGTDDTRTLSLGFTYSPTRRIDLGCTVSRERRTVSADVGGLSFPYEANSAGCSARWWLGQH